MDYLKYTDLRNHSKEFFDKVEDGSSYIIIRKGKPIAKITPFQNKPAGWKRKIKKVTLKKKVNTLDYILKERDEK